MKMNNFTRFIVKPIIRVSISIIIPIISTILMTLCFDYYQTKPLTGKFFFCCIIFGVITIVYIVIQVFLLNYDTSYKDEIDKSEKFTNAYKQSLQAMLVIYKEMSSCLNNMIHKYYETGIMNLKGIWNFDAQSEVICERVFPALEKLASDNPVISVGYVKLHEECKEQTVSLCGYHTNSKDKHPSIYRKNRKLNDKNPYHDITLFKKFDKDRDSDCEALLTREAVENAFSFKASHKVKYSQYFAVPVICISDSESKMVGMLEIICLDNTILAKDEEAADYFIKHFLVPISYLFLLVHKIEKCIIATSS